MELECEIYVGEAQLEQLSEFKYLGYVLDESGTDNVVLLEGGVWEKKCSCQVYDLMLRVCSLKV